MRDANLAEIIRRQGHERPIDIAFVAPQRTWSFGEVDAESSRIGQGLARIGVGKGDRVACLSRHTVDCALLYLAAAKIGAVAMPVNWRLAASELEYVIHNGEAKFLLVDEAFRPTLAKADLGGMKVVSTEGCEQAESFSQWRASFDAVDPGHQGDLGDTAIQLYSSGTTGLPKGVELMNEGLMESLQHYAAALGFDAGSVMLHALPVFHIAGVTNIFVPLQQGGTTVTQSEYDPAAVVAAIGAHRVSHVFLVPAMILMLLRSPAAGAGDFSSLKIVAYGGSPIAENILIEAKQTLNCGLLQTYGMTEQPLHTRLLPADHDPGGPRAYLLRSAGRPAPGVSLRIVDPATHQDLPEGEVGEVWARTRQSFKGYWRNDAATREAFPYGRDEGGGWLRTGDAAYFQDGYLYIQDRIKDMIKSGGENIYPAEVENVLAQHPCVAECAVLGVPDDEWGEGVKACVVRKFGTTVSEREIIDFTRERMAHYKCPKSVDFLDALPRNPSGKVLKRVLREPFWQGRARHIG